MGPALAADRVWVAFLPKAAVHAQAAALVSPNESTSFPSGRRLQSRFMGYDDRPSLAALAGRWGYGSGGPRHKVGRG